jgi:EAL domain-containing protein (putative c-di-GMP-specific phosphodiesterase class I)
MLTRQLNRTLMDLLSEIEQALPEDLRMIRTVEIFTLTLVRTVIRALSQARKSRLLHALNCDEMHGLLFGKPVPSEIFKATLSVLRSARVKSSTPFAVWSFS